MSTFDPPSAPYTPHIGPEFGKPLEGNPIGKTKKNLELLVEDDLQLSETIIASVQCVLIRGDRRVISGDYQIIRGNPQNLANGVLVVTDRRFLF